MKSISKESLTDAKTEVDIYRDTPLRYLGYANEVGEAFRGVVLKSVVWLSYVVATGYVLADTVHKSLQIYQKDTTPDKKKYVILSASDTLLWQSFASVIIPGFTINRLCAAVRYVQRKSNSTMKGPWVPIAVGLASIPLIIHPIDVAVEETMNVSYRKWTGYHPKEPLDRIREKD